MPYESKSQQRFFHAHEGDPGLSFKVVREWDKATDFEHLPDKKKKKDDKDTQKSVVMLMDEMHERDRLDLAKIPRCDFSKSFFKILDL